MGQEVGHPMFTLEEKKYLLELLRSRKRRSWFKKTPDIHDRLIEKLAQMIRNEEINRR
jgi:hypothetical protein